MAGLTRWPARLALSASRCPSKTALLFFCLGLVALLMYWRALAYPFIQDDWQWLLAFRQAEASGAETEFIRSLFSFEGKLFYRPLGILYLFGVSLWASLNPVVFHALALLIHTVCGLLVALLVWELTADREISVGAALLYVGATSVHLDPLLWAVGIFELGAALFFFLALCLFLRQRRVLSAAAFGVALLFKESALILPAVLLCLVIGRRGARWQFRDMVWVGKMWPHLVAAGGFCLIKAHGASPLSFPESHPYVVDLWGWHLLRNGYRYLAWLFQAVVPLSLPFHKLVNAGLFGLLLVGLSLMGMWLRRRPVCGTGRDVGGGTMYPWLAWCLVAVVPLLALPHHAFRYYLTLSLPAFVVLCLVALRAAVRCMVSDDRVRHRVRIVAVGCCLLTSAYHVHRVHGEGLEQSWLVDGTNSLVMRAATVEKVYGGLVRAGQELPEGATVVFKEVDLWALGKDSALRLWYGDDDIRVYDYDYLREDAAGLYLDSPPENQAEGYTGGKERKVYLDMDRTLAFGLEDGELRPIRLGYNGRKP